MKFWELTSAFRSFDKQLSSVLTSGQWSQPYGEWYNNLDQLVQSQDRTKLDAEIPEKLLAEVSTAVGDRLVFFSGEGWIRNRRVDPADTKMTVLEVAMKYGGSVIEEVLEYGSCKVET